MINSTHKGLEFEILPYDCFIGTTAALIGMAIASAGAKTVSSVVEAKAANKAVKTQVAATNAVQAKQDSIYADYQKQMAPYLQSGQQSMSLLSSLMLPPGAPGSYQSQQQQQPPRPSMAGGPPQGMPGMGPGGPPPMGGPGGGGPPPQMQQRPQMNPWAMPPQGPQGPPPQGGPPQGMPPPMQPPPGYTTGRMQPWAY